MNPDYDSTAPGGDSPESWHALPPETVLERLGAHRDGLSFEEARRRTEIHGPNLLPRVEGPGPLRILWRQVNEPLIWVLVGSGLLALAMGKGVDGAVVLGVVVVNSLIGFVQEFRAGKAIRALMDIVPEGATVIRGGERHQVPAADLVPGDVVVVESGDKAPADLRLLEVRSLRSDEAMLTGESVPVSKGAEPVAEEAPLAERRSMVYGGSMVVSGAALGAVVATGADTELGRISSLLQSAEDLETPLVRQLARVGQWLAVAIVAVSMALLGVGLARGYPLVDGLLVAVTLAVAAIPEGLPAIVTIALAIGVQRMAGRKALIRSLPAAETLGGTTVICSDKTGTLTRNEMTAQVLVTPDGSWRLGGVGYEPSGSFRGPAGQEVQTPAPGVVAPLPEPVLRLVTAGTLCSDADLHRGADGSWGIAGDPTEGALVVAAAKAGLCAADLRQAWPRVDAIPFESERRYMATLHTTPNGGGRLVVKGAPEVIFERCGEGWSRSGGADVTRLASRIEELAREGMRVLAVAERELDPGQMAALRPGVGGEGSLVLNGDALADDQVRALTLLGLVAMIDPPRPEVIEAIRRCRRAGVRVKMITGDHRDTAVAIGRQLGLTGDLPRGVVGAELDQMDEAAVAAAVDRESVFARVAPEHKLRLVRALQGQGEVVAMTGDGVNDSPALKQADIGVAMGVAGTAASREAADIVLADDNFATIAAAVEEGRRIYDNLLKSFAFVLPTNLGLALILLTAVMAFPIVGGNPVLPMTPTQTLWINLVAAVALALPLAFEAMEPHVMDRPPRSRDEELLGGFVLWRSVLVAVLMTIGAVGLFVWEFDAEVGRGVVRELALAEAQTMAVTTVVFFQIFYLFNCRSLRDSIFDIGVFSNPKIFVGIGVLLVLQAGLIYLPLMNELFGTAPLPPSALLKSLLVGLIVLPAISVEKWVARRAWGWGSRDARSGSPPSSPTSAK
jgi:Ca2+-transporting ATPase